MAADAPSTGAFGADATAPAAAPAPAAPAAPPASAAAAPGTVRTLSAEERLLLEQNQRIKSLNRAPDDFPAFIRKGARAAPNRPKSAKPQPLSAVADSRGAVSTQAMR
jgi:hypothetical protein